MRLTPATAASGYRLLVLGTTRSTNDDALRAAGEGDAGKLWIVADAQSAGRGRHGRTWTSPEGNLHASLLLVDVCEPPLAPQLGFVAGLALHEAVAEAAGVSAPRLALKWPNDLLLDGAKVAGLLLEAHRVDGRLATVVGFGVNVAAAPADTPYPATSLAAASAPADRGAVFAALAAAFARGLDAWLAGGDAFAAIRARWLARAAGIGAPVSLRLPSGDIAGTFEGIDESGRLRLRMPAGLRTIDAGDLYFPTAPAGAPAPDRRATGDT